MDARVALGSAGRQQDGLATRRQLLRVGLTPKGLTSAVAAGELVRVRRRVYAAAPLAPPGRQLLTGGFPDEAYVRHVRAALLSMPLTARAGRRTAAVLWGFDLAVEPDRIEVDALSDRVRTADMDVRRDPSCRRPGLTHDGVRIPSALDTVIGCVLDRPLVEGVAVADSALRARAVDIEALRGAVSSRSGKVGHTALARAVRLVDPRSGSVLESMLRVLLAQNGLTPPRTQFEIRRADGTFVARVDFCWPRHRLVVEADGRRWHDPEDARSHDRRRANELEVLGWGVLRFGWGDVVQRPEYVVATVRAALARRAAA